MINALLMFSSVTVTKMEIVLPNLRKCTISAYYHLKLILNTPSLLELDLSKISVVQEIICNSKCALDVLSLCLVIFTSYMCFKKMHH